MASSAVRSLRISRSQFFNWCKSLMVLVMLKWELEGFLHTHIFQGNAWAWFGASVRVSLKSTQLLARAPGDVKRSARSKRFLNAAVLQRCAHTHAAPFTNKKAFFFFLLKMFLVPQTRNICLGWTRHVVQPARLPACARVKRSSVGDYFASSCGLGATERAACCVCCAEIRWPPGRTGHHAPAVGCTLDRSCAPVRGGGTILQRPV